MDQTNKNEGNQSKCVLELYESCEKGYYTKIKKLLEDESFSRKTLDNAMRKCMKYGKRDSHEYLDSLNLLLQYMDINFTNPEDDNSTIIMYSCKAADVGLVDIILGFDYSMNHSFPDSKIDLQIKDNNGKNFLHYLVIKDNQEDEACEVYERFLKGSRRNSSNKNEKQLNEIIEENKNNLNNNFNKDNYTIKDKKIQNNILNYNLNITKELNVEDKLGYTPLALALQQGWAQLSKKFIQAKAKGNLLIKSSSSNLVHVAVTGKNLNCIKLILPHYSTEDLKVKNKDGFTPKELALNLGLNYYSKIIENYEENSLNPNFIDIFSNKNQMNISNIFKKLLNNDEYDDTLFILNQFKINQSILSNQNNYQNYNIEYIFD
jgi:hypothetical protein